MPASPKKKFTGLVASLVFVLILIVAGIDALQRSDSGSVANPPGQTGPSGQPGQTSAFPGWLAVYFTNPNPPDALGSGIDQNILPVIAAATKTIDVTSFDLNLPDLVNALIAASKRGVKVRVVYDGVNGNLDLENAATNNTLFQAITRLKAAKVALVDGGRSNGLMHDKMIIVDGQTLFMGSWNLSYNDTYRNNNNLLKITNSGIIANYQAKFDEMFLDKRFGAQAEVKIPNPSLTLDGVAVENYFSPEDEVMTQLVNYVKGAKKSVHFMIFTYTSADLSNAMIARSRLGVDVQGVIENRGASNGALQPLYCAKMNVKVDGNKYTMHHKVIIIDGMTVVTGSYNFTKAADTANDDNVLVIHSPAVADLYEQEYQRIRSAAGDPDPSGFNCNQKFVEPLNGY